MKQSTIIILWLGFCMLFYAKPTHSQLLPGATKGSFRYGAGGAATYTIKIDIPPGTQGIQPRIALSYSSHGGNGPMGEGWQLQAGSSSIVRRGQQFELDGNRRPIQWTLDDPSTPSREGDRFTLDGQPLILATGTYGGHGSTYRTRMESWKKVTCTDLSPAVPGPESFTVQDKDGLTFEYGLYQPHRVAVDGANSHVQQWRLTQVTDRNNNWMYYGYSLCSPGEKGGPDQCSSLEGVESNLHYISYTANPADPNMPQRVVEFVYQDRPDISVNYRAGYPFKSSKRLHKIITYVDREGDNGNWADSTDWETRFSEDIVRKYVLSYDQSPITGDSRLISVQEYDGEGNYLPATTFAWTGTTSQKGFELGALPSQNLPVFTEVKNWANKLHKGKYNEGTHLIDLNGDGLKDIIQGKWRGDLGANSVPEVTRRIVLNRGDHWEELSNHPYLTDWEAAGQDIDGNPSNGRQGDGALFAGRGYFSGATPGFSMGTRIIDINGDGLPDLLQLLDSWKAHPDHDDDPCNCQGGCCSNGDLEYPSWGVQLLLNEGEDEGWHLVQPNDPEYAWISQLPQNGQGVPGVAFDQVWRATSDIGPTDFQSASGGVQISDVNGDGLPDLIQAKYRSGSTKRVFINRGPDNPGWERNTIYETSFVQIPSTVGFSYESNTIDLASDLGTRIRDLNGDGLPDIIALNKERVSWYTFPEVVRVYLNQGNDGGFVLDQTFTNSLKGQDGKGLLHFTRLRSDKTDQRGTRLIDVNRDGLPDLLSLLKEDNNSVRKLMLNTGKEFVEASWTLPPSDVYFDFYKDGTTYDGGTRWADINQDGLPDLFNFIKGDGVHAGNARKNVYILEFGASTRGWSLDNSWKAGLPGTGSDYAYFTGVTGSPFNVFDFGTRLDDINGDGRLDIVQLAQVDQLGTFKRIYTAKTGNDPDGQTSVDKLIQVQNGIGTELRFRYLPMTDTAVYTRGFSSSYPTKDLISSAQVLYESESVQTLDNDGIRNDLINPESRVVRYHYAESRVKLDSQEPNELGAGSLGFRVVKALDVNRDIETATTYIQNDFPFTGRTKEVEKREATSGWRLETQTPIFQHLAYTLPGGLTYRVIPFKNTVREFEGYTLSGQRVVNSQDRDSFGNVTRVHSEEDSLYIHQWYQNDTSAGEWVVGKLVRKASSSSIDPNDKTAFLKLKSWDIGFASGSSRLLVLHDSSWVRNANGTWRPIVKGFTYDAFGNPIRHTSSPGSGGPLLISEMTYDPDFHSFVIGQKNPLGHQIMTTHDPGNGNVVWLKDANGLHHYYEYDGFGREVKVFMESPPGIQTGIAIPGNGNIVGDTLDQDRFLYVSGEISAGPAVQIEPLVHVSLTSGTAVKLKPGFRAGSGSSFKARVADMQLVREISHNWADPANKKGFYVRTTDLRKNWSYPGPSDYKEQETYTDAWGRTYLEVRKGGSEPDIHLRSSFNNVGLVGGTTAPYFSGDSIYWTETAYDYKNRPLLVTFPGQHPDSAEVISYSYGMVSFRGKPHRYIDQIGRRSEHIAQGYHTRTVKDEQDHIAFQVFYHNGNSDTVFYSYDQLGHLTSVLAQKNKVGQREETVAIFDELDRKVGTREWVWDGNQVIDSSYYEYAYDDLGNQTLQKDPLGNTKEVFHDELGRVERESFPYDLAEVTGEVVEIIYQYDLSDHFGIGKMASVSGYDGNGSLQFEYEYDYDRYGNLAEEQVKIAGWGDRETTKVTYQPSGAKESIAFPDGRLLELEYSNWGKLKDLSMNTTYGMVSANFLNYTAYGTPGQIVLGNGVSTDYTYQPQNGRLADMDVKQGNSFLEQKVYHWDAQGMLRQIEDLRTSNATQTFVYDDLLRLSQAQSPLYPSRNFDYDGAGNLTLKANLSMLEFTGIKVTKTQDANGGFIWYDYNAAGNLVGKERGNTRGGSGNETETVKFDPNNRLIFYDNNEGDQNQYWYDHRGRRIRKVEGDGATTYYISPVYEILVDNGKVSRTKYVDSATGRLIQVTTLD